MAFVMRTTRADADPNAKYKTPAHVGPGAYELSKGIAKSRPSYAPFGATARRTSGPKRTIITPGPGTYNKLDFNPSFNVTGNSSSFRSHTKRFNPKSGDMDTPGPGAYLSNKTWKKRPNYAVEAHRAKSKATKNETRDIPPRQAVPSIPSRWDNFGYKETPEGELRRQANPTKSRTGVGNDTPGPGEYQHQYGIGMSKKGGSSFGKSLSQRIASPTKNRMQVPGPGYYEKDSNVVDDDDDLDPPRCSSNFASSTKRGTKTSRKAEPTPGPGAYETAKVENPFMKKKVAENLQFFGSTSRRFGGTNAQRLDRGRPGPGAYNLKSQFARRNKRRTDQVLRNNNVMTIEGGRMKERSKPVPFFQTAARFKNQKETGPAPGDNLSSASTSFVKILERKPVSRCTTFGSTTKRFFRPAKDVETPGPGNYNIDEIKSQATQRLLKKKSSNFASKTTRFRKNKKITLPDPGAYDINSTWSSGKRRTGTMQYGTERFADQKPNLETPGPGEYDVTRRRKNLKNRRNVFGAASERFKPAQSKYTVQNPGPGQYNTENLYGNLNKPTFNMSIAEAMYQ